jgi:hypothetical protein
MTQLLLTSQHSPFEHSAASVQTIVDMPPRGCVPALHAKLPHTGGGLQHWAVFVAHVIVEHGALLPLSVHGCTQFEFVHESWMRQQSACTHVAAPHAACDVDMS